MTAVLEARGIEKKFDGTIALNGVDFTLEQGEIHALLGENGAGKSTLSKVLAGVVTPDRGQIRLAGNVVRILSPAHAQALGIAMVFQELDLFPHLTIAENLAIMNSAASEGMLVRRGSLNNWSAGFLKRVELDVEPNVRLGTLSVSNRQLVAIARALSVGARIILMDEPTSSLSDANAAALFRVMTKLKQDGVSIVYISHKMEEVKQVADRVTVLRDGARIGTHTTKEITIDQLVTQMVGRSFRTEKRASHSPGATLLEVRALATKYISGINFSVRAGEVLGIAGLVGSGRSELGAALYGLRSGCGMDAEFLGQRFAPESPSDAIRKGLCLLPEERRSQALLPNMSAMENATISIVGRFSRRLLLQSTVETVAAAAILDRVRLGRAKSDAPIVTLSGGNQQKVVLARWLLANPRVLFLDEPTRGIDIGAKEIIYEVIDDFVAGGRGIILVSSELPELLRCCDRLLVLCEGRQSGVVDAVTTSQEEIFRLATSK